MSSFYADAPGIGLPKTKDLLVTLIALYISVTIVTSIYNAFFGPLSKFPGPKLRALTVWPKILSIFRGCEAVDYPAIHRKYGPVVRIAPNELSYIGDAQVFKDIHGFKKMGERAPFKDPKFIGRPMYDVYHILVADDANHSRQRKILSHAFADKSLRDLEPMLKSWVAFMVKKLNERASAGEKVDMLKYFNCTTFDIMADLCFNESLHMLENTEYSPWVKTIFRAVKVVTPIRAVKSLGSSVDYLLTNVITNNKTVRKRSFEHWNYCAERVDKRLAHTPKRSDLWSKILEKSSGPEALTLNEHYANAMVFMAAGTETSATALNGITYHLLKNPAAMSRLTHEIRSAFRDLDAVTLDGMHRLQYLNAVINEGLRLYPPVPIAMPRIVPKGGTFIRGEHVPEGTTVGIHHFATYRSEENFREASAFRPERWMKDPEFEGDNLAAVEPFMVGPRNCIGKNLAWHEIRLILVAALLHFDLSLCEESSDWVDQKVYLLWEKKPLICNLKSVKAVDDA